MMTIDDFAKKVNGVSLNSYEKLLRDEFPALEDAWEQYQVILTMYKSQYPQPQRGHTAAEILESIRKRNRAQ